MQTWKGRVKMTKDSLDDAMAQARRFLAVAQIVADKVAADPKAIWWPSRENATVKRASMDLSNALVKLRRG